MVILKIVKTIFIYEQLYQAFLNLYKSYFMPQSYNSRLQTGGNIHTTHQNITKIIKKNTIEPYVLQKAVDNH